MLSLICGNVVSLNFLFFKIDFDKAYDRVEWDLCFKVFMI